MAGPKAQPSLREVLRDAGLRSTQPRVAISELGLRCGACGYPIVDSLLRWHPQIHVSGPLAELEIGPVSRNIVGARLAALRLLGSLH